MIDADLTRIPISWDATDGTRALVLREDDSALYRDLLASQCRIARGDPACPWHISRRRIATLRAVARGDGQTFG
jgi:hypothetical protein